METYKEEEAFQPLSANTFSMSDKTRQLQAMGFAANKVSRSAQLHNFIYPTTNITLPFQPPPLPPNLLFQADFALRLHGDSLELAINYLLVQPEEWQPPPADARLSPFTSGGSAFSTATLFSGSRSIEPWRDPLGVDVSGFPTTGQVRFKNSFATVRGPAFHRSQSEGFFEIRVIKAGPCPQFGFCTSDFTKTPGRSNTGCGDDAHSWGWDGQRNIFWQNAEMYRPTQISWSVGDVLQFKVDFTCSTTYFSKNGQVVHGHAFSFGISTLYPCISAEDAIIQVSLNTSILQLGVQKGSLVVLSSETRDHSLLKPGQVGVVIEDDGTGTKHALNRIVIFLFRIMHPCRDSFHGVF
jgi:hypothetical protein